MLHNLFCRLLPLVNAVRQANAAKGAAGQV
jgi:hypothetical protein